MVYVHISLSGFSECEKNISDVQQCTSLYFDFWVDCKYYYLKNCKYSYFCIILSFSADNKEWKKSSDPPHTHTPPCTTFVLFFPLCTGQFHFLYFEGSHI